MRSRIWMCLAATAFLATTPAIGLAQDTPTPPSTSGSSAEAQALELNRQGVTLLDAGDTERALDYFLRSRAVLPSTKNTANAAICLQRLGRYDEALELYEEVLVRFADGLDEEDRAVISPAMAALRKKVGNVAVSSNVADARVVVDTRERGKLPLPAPVRVLAGRHVVRVMKSGYETFEKTIDVAAEQNITVDAVLQPLKDVGQLVIEDGAAPGSDVFVDRVHVGVTPWEGSLAPGNHLVWTEKGDVGSAPTAVTVLQGQTALVRLESAPLGGMTRIRVEPRTARIDLDGAPLGIGSFEKRFPAGTYTLVISEPGYHTTTQRVAIPANGAAKVVVTLEVDPDHPRWPAREDGRVWISAFGGYAGGGTLDSGAEAQCPDRCSGDPSVSGIIVGARGGYRFPIGLSLELGGGFLSLGTSLQRSAESQTGPGDATTVHYTLYDDISVQGPFASLGASYRLLVEKHFHLGARTSVGLLFARSRDPLLGTASTNGPSVPVVDEDRNQTLNSAAVFLYPEVSGGMEVMGFDVGVHIGAAFFATDGPEFERDRFGAQTSEGSSDPTAVTNAQESDVVASERAYGRFILWVPTLSIARAF